jgi:hypothetical protein
LIERGLRAQLKSGNLLIGELMVDLDFHPESPPAKLDRSGPYPEIPAVPAQLEALEASVTASGDYGTLAELAAAERISRSYVCRVLRLTLLAPDIVEQILDGQPTAPLARFLQPFPADWEKQFGSDLIDTARQLERMTGRSNGGCTR